MTAPVLCLAATERVSHVLHVLSTTRHHAFAVVDQLHDGTSELVGLISRRQLHVLLEVRMYLQSKYMCLMDVEYPGVVVVDA